MLLLGVGGLRWGEAAALRVSDVDFLRRRVELTRNAVAVSGTTVVGTLKGGKDRTVALPRFVIDAIAGSCQDIRRVVLEPSENQLQLLDGIVDFTRSEIGMLRDAGLASKKRPESHQILTVLVRQFGELLLQPMIEAVWERAASKGEKQPRLVIRVDH